MFFTDAKLCLALQHRDRDWSIFEQKALRSVLWIGPSGMFQFRNEVLKYCHAMEWLCTGFVFTEHLQNVATSNYCASANSRNLQFPTERDNSSQSAVSSPVDGPLLSGSRPRRLAAISHQPPTLLTAVSRLVYNGSSPPLYSLGTDRTENTASNRSSIVECVSITVIT
jgi:hypothetical protein